MEEDAMTMQPIPSLEKFSDYEWTQMEWYKEHDYKILEVRKKNMVNELNGNHAPEIKQPLRIRINTSTSVKGIITFDCTIEGIGWTQEEILTQHDMLMSQLKSRYPAQGELNGR